MRELSIFIDESGDFGEYSFHSPYYIITMVFHDQSISIDHEIEYLNDAFYNMGMAEHSVHTGPLIRREEEYKNMGIKERRQILNKMVAFIRKTNVKYKSFYIEKKHIADRVEASGKLARLIGSFIRENYDEFLSYDIVKVYYDNGQTEVSKILSSVFNAMLQNVVFRKVIPSDYKLFQVADFCCTFELIRLKMENNGLTKTEAYFFGNSRDLKKNYLKPLLNKEFGKS